jgi:hypothetical protein
MVNKFLDAVNSIPTELIDSKIRLSIDSEYRLGIYIKFENIEEEMHLVTMLWYDETFYYHTMETWNELLWAIVDWEQNLKIMDFEDLFYSHADSDKLEVRRAYRNIREWYLYHKYFTEYCQQEYPHYFSSVGDGAGYQPTEEEIVEGMTKELNEKFNKAIEFKTY